MYRCMPQQMTETMTVDGFYIHTAAGWYRVPRGDKVEVLGNCI